MTNKLQVDGFNYKGQEPAKIIETDVLTVGAGNAGLQAAAAAAEEGAKVIVIEKEDTINLMRVSLAAVGANSQKRANNEIDKYELVEYISAFAQHRVDQSLIYTWVNNSAETLNWLEDNILKPNGAHLRSEPDAGKKDPIYNAYPTQSDTTCDDKTFASYGSFFQDKVEELGVEILFNTSLIELIYDGNGVTGVIARDLENDEYIQINAAKGVILATGGYSANLELLEKWNPISLKKNVINDSPRSNGAGIVSAMNIGAIKDEEPAQLVFDRGLVKPGTKTEDQFTHTAKYEDWLWLASHPFLKVNLRGERFANEATPYEFINNAASKQPGYLYAVIWDSNYTNYLSQHHTLGCARVGFPGYMDGAQAYKEDTEQYIDTGLVHVADTIEELAEKLMLPVETVKATVVRYNELAEKGFDEDFGKEASKLTPVNKGPYYGAVLGGRILATADGLRINNNMQVLDENHDPIEGLYAAGNDSGGFFCGTYPDRVPGLAASRAHVFGRLAGKHAATK